MKERADKLLVERGLADTHRKAQALIMAGRVYSGEEKVDKAGRLYDAAVPLAVREGLPFVGRGGLKLAEALDRFGLEVGDTVVLDIGASTGGFTDCLLQRGARKVFAVDVDIAQLDHGLRCDPRVITIEKNARYLSPEDLPERPDFAVMDVSFISIRKILPALKHVLGSGLLAALVKPQFEADRGRVGRKGIVRDPAVHEEVLNAVAAGAAEDGFAVLDIMSVSTRGRKGNREFFFLLAPGRQVPPAGEIRRRIEEAVGDEHEKNR